MYKFYSKKVVFYRQYFALLLVTSIILVFSSDCSAKNTGKFQAIDYDLKFAGKDPDEHRIAVALRASKGLARYSTQSEKFVRYIMGYFETEYKRIQVYPRILKKPVSERLLQDMEKIAVDAIIVVKIDGIEEKTHKVVQGRTDKNGKQVSSPEFGFKHIITGELQFIRVIDGQIIFTESLENLDQGEYYPRKRADKGKILKQQYIRMFRDSKDFMSSSAGMLRKEKPLPLLPNTARGNLIVDYTISTDNPFNDTIAISEETFTLDVSLKNQGDGPLRNLIVKAGCDSGLKSQKEELTRLDPGANGSCQFQWRSPYTIRDILLNGWIDFIADGGDVPMKKTFHCIVEGLDPPGLSFSYKYREDGGGISSGNGDSILQSNETAEVLLDIRNNGSGSAEDVSVVVTSVDSDCYLNESSKMIGTIKNGDLYQLVFPVKILKRASRTYKLRVHINEKHPQSSISHVIELPARHNLPDKKNPTLDLLEPVGHSVFNHPSIPFKCVIGDNQELHSVECYLDKASEVSYRELLKGQKCVDLSRSIPVCELGSHELLVRVEDTSGNCSEKTVKFRITGNKKVMPETRGERYALLVGISDYQKNDVLDLKYCENDVNQLHKVLVKQDKTGFKPENIEVLTGETATCRNVMKTLDYFKAKMQPDDLFLFYFGGHGVPGTPDAGDPDTLPYYLAMYESDPGNLKNSAIKSEDVLKKLDEIAALQQIVILDSCFSGNTGENVRTFSYNMPRGLSKIGRIQSLVSRKKGLDRCIIMASDKNEEAHEDRRIRHGVFSYFVIEAFEGHADTNSDGMDTWELSSYLRRKVPNYMIEFLNGVNQNPQVFNSLSRFMITNPKE